MPAVASSLGSMTAPRKKPWSTVDLIQRQADVTQHSTPGMRTGSAGLNLTDSVYERLLQERIVVLGSEVNDEIANRITAQLLLLSAEDSEKEIRFYINSPGGSVTAGFAIYDTMQLIEPEVSTYAMGLAASMGQFLLSSGTPGKRYSLPHARILMHQPSAGVTGTASDIAIQAEVFGKWKQELAKITADQTGQSVEQIIADGDRDRWFTAQEAKEYGFVDHVLTREHLASSNGDNPTS